jgi:acyl-CoA hydrolase
VAASATGDIAVVTACDACFFLMSVKIGDTVASIDLR